MDGTQETITKKTPLFKRIFTVRVLISTLIGGALGFFFYYLAMHTAGEPEVSLNPWFTTSYGLILGGLIGRNN